MSERGKWPQNKLNETGNRAWELANKYRDPLTDRLPPGAIEGLAADIILFTGLSSKATRAKLNMMSSTANQNELAERGHRLISACRFSISRSAATKEQKKKFGIGLKVSTGKVSSIQAGLDALVDGYDAHTELARSAGFLESDRELAVSLRDAITQADSSQEKKKERRKLSTAERDALAVRIEKTIDTIIGAGSIAFFDQPEIAQLFTDLIPS